MNTRVAKAVNPIVAVQYPEEVTFKGVADIAALATEYGPLVKIDADSASQYKKLCAALKVVSKERLHVDKEEKRLKDPANAFAKLVLNYAKKIRAPFVTLEDNLKAEKKRVDDIVEERLEAQKRLWRTNLESIQRIASKAISTLAADLPAHLELIEATDLDALDLGDLLEDAKAALANARALTEQGIAQEAERVKLAEERVEHERQVAEQAKLAAENAIADAEEAAYAEDEILTLRAQLAEKETIVEPEEVFVPAATPKANAARMVNEIKEKVIAKAAPPSHSDFDDDPAPAPAPIQNTGDDINAMMIFIQKLEAVTDSAPVDFTNPAFVKASNRVAKNLQQMTVYLNNVKNGGDA